MAWNNYRPGARKGSGSKYHNEKVLSEDGEVFDSRREHRRYKELKLLEKVGVIKGLQRQVPYIIIPEQREPDTTGPRGGKKPGRILERKVEYFADFVYEERKPDGIWKTVVEDCKGMRTPDYIIKRKLMLHVHGIRLRET